MTFTKKRPTRASFSGGRALHHIYDENGIKWIAKGQQLTEDKIEIALRRGTLTSRELDYQGVSIRKPSKQDLKPTYQDIVDITKQLGEFEDQKNRELILDGKLSGETQSKIKDSAQSIMQLIESNQFSPYKLIGLTSYLYQDDNFKSRRPFLKTLSSSGTQVTLFRDIVEQELDDIVVASVISPFGVLEAMQDLKKNEVLNLDGAAFKSSCSDLKEKLSQAMDVSEISTPFIKSMLNYFSPYLYFVSPEVRLFQQTNQYLNFIMPGRVQEKNSFNPKLLPVVNLSKYFQRPEVGGGLGVEGLRIVQYMGLIPSGTAIQFKNREKGIVIAPKRKDVQYCVKITGMDGQPLQTPSLTEIQFKDLNKTFKVIASKDLPLKYDQHNYDKIWKMHIVHEKLKR